MSDFDREAERERLREQFEEDKRQRAQSEQMSELLLKGATMTNVHCDRCGDPIFRWDGQEFCPTCQGGPGGEPTAAAETDQTDAASDEQSGATADASSVEVAPESTAEEPSVTEQSDGDAQRARQPGGSTPDPARRDPATAASDADGVTAARASLARTLAALSRRAEQAEDLSATREYLNAAKEAAEALEAAERVQS